MILDIDKYKRKAKGENAGLTLQAIAYGYAKADRPFLSISVDKVRSGSSRQRRFGDVDGYDGIDLGLSIEVKDKNIKAENVQKELGTFMKKVKANRIRGLALVAAIEDDLRGRLAESDVTAVTVDEMKKTWRCGTGRSKMRPSSECYTTSRT